MYNVNDDDAGVESVYIRSHVQRIEAVVYHHACLPEMDEREREREVDSGYKLSQPGCSLFFIARERSRSQRAVEGVRRNVR